jgi:hypothetical protein
VKSGFHFECAATNNICQAQTCNCDLEFVSSLIENLKKVNTYFMTAGGWNPAESCEANTIFAQEDQSFMNRLIDTTITEEVSHCCGENPKRLGLLF